MKNRRLSLCLSLLSMVMSQPLFASVTVSSPSNGATVGTSVHYVASSSASTCAKGVASMGVYVNNKLTYLQNGTSLNTNLSFTPGTYQTVVQEWDYCGGATLTPINIIVTAVASSVLVSSPTENSKVNSPATFIATATAPSCAKGVASMGIYVDNQLDYVVNGAEMNTQLNLTSGVHHTAVQEWDYCGGATFTPIDVTVGASANACPTISVLEAGPQARPPAPTLPAPSPGSTTAGSVCVSSPGNGAQVTSPFSVTAEANLLQAPIEYMRVYVDGSADYFTFYNQFSALLWMPAGVHTIEVLATDTNGNNMSNTFSVNVTGPGNDVVSNIQEIPNWEPCSANYDPGTPRAGQICAAGNGNAVSTMMENIATPSLSGESAHFTMGGPVGYSNELYTQNLGGGDSPTHFVYDLYVMVDSSTAPQALEFDVNQAINDTRWVFGSECNFNGNYPNVGEWDVWDGIAGWEKTTAPCPQFVANTWNHIVWTFERVGQQVHYVSLQVNNTVYPLNLYYAAEKSWSMGQINVAFQMDGNYNQTFYNAWIDKVNLTVY